MLPNTNSVYLNHILSVNVVKDMKAVILTDLRQEKVTEFKCQELYKTRFSQGV